ncbi:hypothetical protein SIN09_31065 [Streptomyces sp. F8]|uniref:hypothetical protein n=1 Tax=Streptomyces sp. F8 TaxID=1436085 RepID=UPI0029D206C5|nr:hypothetical protein [Streptomyces sp. F8]MDX6763726.1 hypothetical protein [Streptomyces sp. F8]
MRRPIRTAGVLTGLILTLGGIVAAAPDGHAAPTAPADIPACTQMAAQAGTETTDAVTAACRLGVVADLQGCVNGLTEAGVPGGAAAGACRLAAQEPR